MLDLEYQKRILDWIPKQIFDMHNHVGLPRHHSILTAERKRSCIGVSIAYSQAIGKLEKIFKLLLPGIKLNYVAFPFPFIETKIKEANNYALKCENPFVLGNLDNPKETSELLRISRVKGLKVYHDFIKKDYTKISILDFLPETFLYELNKSFKPVMLHVKISPVDDYKNISELNYIFEKFPKIRIILAHMGGCQTKMDVVNASRKLKQSGNIFLETSTVSSPDVFEEAIIRFGTEHILYGSDSPYTFTKGKIMAAPGEIQNKFITEKRFPWTKRDDRKWYLNNKPELTFLLYHQLDVMGAVFKNLDIKKKDLEKIFYWNAIKVLNI